MSNLLEAYQLMHSGALALADISQNGIHIDVEYCERQQRLLDRQIIRLENKIKESKEVKLWRSIYKDKFNLDSPKQLADVLYNHLGIEPPKYTDNENPSPSVDKDALNTLSKNISFIADFLELRKTKKMRNTYLESIIRETVDGYLHPFFNLHLVQTFRSSSDHLNFQNLPIRDKEMGKIIRRAIIPRPGYQIIGADYSGIEVRVAACYHHDPKMLEYLSNPAKDMHRDMASEIYMLTTEETSKEARFAAKNGFVFPQFYGDYWKSCAKILWTFIDELNLRTAKTDIPMKKHLKSKGIKNLTDFENHLKRVEDDFWNKRFMVYNRWKEKVIAEYERTGYLDSFTGFRFKGVMAKNKVTNYPVQSSAFHCLLWSLIQIHDILKKENWKTKIIGQIHDELVADVHPEERDDYLRLINKVMCHDIREHWPWLITKLDIEATATPIDGNWFLKKEIEIPEYKLRVH